MSRLPTKVSDSTLARQRFGRSYEESTGASEERVCIANKTSRSWRLPVETFFHLPQELFLLSEKIDLMKCRTYLFIVQDSEKGSKGRCVHTWVLNIRDFCAPPASPQTAREPNSSFSPESSLLLHFSPSTRHFRTQYLPSTRSPPPPASRFDPSLLWRSEKILWFFVCALTIKSAKLGNLKLASFVLSFPERVSSFRGFSRRRRWSLTASNKEDDLPLEHHFPAYLFTRLLNLSSRSCSETKVTDQIYYLLYLIPESLQLAMLKNPTNAFSIEENLMTFYILEGREYRSNPPSVNSWEFDWF
ncbi:hypothetical protein F2Q70_00021475 [Brassica cretica]|uniref:Uncharacterized protein n=1 Tax=Brassica cretica TaxID=69181 RepID=A0A8S9GNV3_BRACR|nr:hypothetical protein F2Q70_00021475 [Brassica cretica]